jgi:hypothetical protein
MKRKSTGPKEPSIGWGKVMYEGCHRVYKERLADKYALKKNFDGKEFVEIAAVRHPLEGKGIANDYKKCGFSTRVVQVYGKYRVFVRKE